MEWFCPQAMEVMSFPRSFVTMAGSATVVRSRPCPSCP